MASRSGNLGRSTLIWLIYSSPKNATTVIAQPHIDPLLDRCRHDDRQAQFDIYRRYAKAMYHTAYQITRDRMEAEDVLQEAFVRAFRNLPRFKGESTFGAWLKRIVINTAINHLKRRKAEFVDLVPERLDLPTEQPQSAYLPWNMQQIQQAIDCLPEGYRQVFELYLLEGYDHKEIGDILHISEATSKSQYSRARKRLRELLQDMKQGLGQAELAMG